MKTVAVIGAGPAGLAATKELKQAGLDPTVFESLGSVGGKWSRDEQDTGIWKELCLNLSRRWMEYSDFPWETNIPKNSKHEGYARCFAHHEEMRDYIAAYAKHFALVPHVQFKTTVVSAMQINGGWTIVTKPVGGDKETSQTFDGLVVCSGFFRKKNHPLAKSLTDYTGQLMHAEQLKSIKDFKGKSVLVVGSTISGPEISAVLSSKGECKEVCSSVRKVHYHISKISPFNKRTFDDLMFIRFPVWLCRLLPDSMMKPGLKSVVTENFLQLTKGENCYEDPDPDVMAGVFSTSANYVENVNEGKLKVVPGITSAVDKMVTFTDGSKKEFDVIICGTGYRSALHFFAADLKEKLLYEAAGGHQEVGLYRECLVPETENLAFVRLSNFVGPVCPLVEMEARLVAAVFSEQVNRPPLAKMKATVAKERESRQSCKFKQHKVCVAIMEEIGDDLGVTPSLYQAFREPSKYLFAPCYPVQYRVNPSVDGKEVAEKARERFEYYLANPQLASF